jgi:2,4-dienoyl-CoA reductase-like NADH-dependent reductase (Old Yellow Enzyme family)
VKRSTALRALSHQHHQGLFAALQLKRAGRKTAVNRDPATLREVGERLESHIRFEGRVLFPTIEEALPVDELERLGAAFARAEADGE